MSTPREQLADLLRQTRIDAGYASQGALASRMKVSRPVISRAENATAAIPSQPLLTSWSGVTGAPLDKLNDLAERCKSGTPAWFMPYRQAESEATTLRSWAPLIFPGLTQTEAYAREVITGEPITPRQLAELLQARIERQTVLRRAFYTVVIGASVFDNCVGGPQIMADQCAHLIELAELPNVTILVVPAGTNHGAWGALDIATREGLSTVCFSTATDDLTTNAADRCERAQRTFERILALALTPDASLSFVRTQEERWKTQI